MRFSARQRSGLAWPGDTASLYGPHGRALAQYFWDYGQQGAPFAYFTDDSNEAITMRVHQFNHVHRVGPVLVGLRLKEPDNSPDDTSLTMFRTLQVTQVTPVACARFEHTTTWRLTDQVFSAGCSTLGLDIQYRWQFDAGGPWTPYSSDTLYDYFPGHSAAGPHTVTLEAHSTTSGLSGTTPYAFTVASDRLLMTGRTFVTDKAHNPYRGYKNDTQPAHRYRAWWFERYEDNPRWWEASGPYPQDSIVRIWPAGEYTVDLREDSSTAGRLNRSRLHVRVCNPPSPSCELLAAPLRAPVAAPSALEDWGLVIALEKLLDAA